MSFHADPRAQSRARSRPRADVGTMTAAMRAATPASEPRALRVAVVVDGRIVEERLVRRREPAVVGEARFEIDRGAFVLCVPSGATGHLVAAAGKIELGPRAQRVVLDDSSRGRMAIGRATILFQLVVPPPQAQKPRLPLGATKTTVDWSLTIVAAFSFLIHFGVVGAMFSDWLDPVVADEGAVVRLVDTTSHAVAPEVEERGSSTSTASCINNAGAKTSTSASTSHAASLAHDAESMKLELLAALNAPTAVEGALRRSEFPLPDLERVARDPKGAEPTGGELTLATGGATVPGTKRLTSIGDDRLDPTHAPIERVVVGPKAGVEIIHSDPPPNLPGLDPVIAQLRPSYRSCYVKKGLSVDPSMQGKLTIEIVVAPNGDVSSVSKVSGEGLSSAVEQCIIQRTQNASFPAPGGSGARARVPIIFLRQ